jgi:hypothetical protein
MLRRAFLAVLPLLAAWPALASAKPEKKEGESTGGTSYIDLSSAAMPIVVSGQLVNYVFVSVRIMLTSTADSMKLRAKAPYFRDALVRAGHRTPFTNLKDYSSVDVPKLQAAMMREATAIAGPGTIKAILVTSQTPKRRVGLPKSGGRDGGEIHP